MSKKHNVKHPERSTSRYPARLTARGLSKAPELESLEVLLKRQERRIEETCTIGDDHDRHQCNGTPYWISSGDADAIDVAA